MPGKWPESQVSSGKEQILRLSSEKWPGEPREGNRGSNKVQGNDQSLLGVKSYCIIMRQHKLKSSINRSCLVLGYGEGELTGRRIEVVLPGFYDDFDLSSADRYNDIVLNIFLVQLFKLLYIYTERARNIVVVYQLRFSNLSFCSMNSLFPSLSLRLFVKIKVSLSEALLSTILLCEQQPQQLC